jgi:hypothetical protein
MKIWCLAIAMLQALAVTSARAQNAPPWKVLACIVESPVSQQGTLFTIYFTEAGQAQILQKPYPATISPAEIRFVNEYGTVYVISRILGRFWFNSSAGTLTGSCTPGETPKF